MPTKSHPGLLDAMSLVLPEGGRMLHRRPRLFWLGGGLLGYALVVLAVPHQVYRDMGVDRLGALVTEGGTFADFKNCFPNTAMPSHIANYWRL